MNLINQIYTFPCVHCAYNLQNKQTHRQIIIFMYHIFLYVFKHNTYSNIITFITFIIVFYIHAFIFRSFKHGTQGYFQNEKNCGKLVLYGLPCFRKAFYNFQTIQ